MTDYKLMPVVPTQEMLDRVMGIVTGFSGPYGEFNDYLDEETAREVYATFWAYAPDVQEEPVGTKLYATQQPDEECDDQYPLNTLENFINEWGIRGHIEKQLVAKAWHRAIESVSSQPTVKPAAPDVKQDDYKTWYEEAIIASNNAGFAGMSAAQVIEYQDGEIKCLRTGVDVLVKALELISNTDPDEGTAWFHEVAHKALAAYRNQVEPSDDNK